MKHFKAEFFKTLAHPTRLRILDALRDVPLAVTELQERLGLEQPNVSQHLAVLRAGGFVQATRDGNSVRYSIPDPAIVQLLDIARDIYDRQLLTDRAHFEATR